MTDKDSKFFAKPKPDAREALNKASGALDQIAARDRETATAIDAKQAELLRTHLTPELTPFGTQPKKPPTDQEARAMAEKHVAAQNKKRPPGGGPDDDGGGKPPPSARAKPDDKADRKVKDDNGPQVRKVDAVSRKFVPDSDHHKTEEVTKDHIEEVITPPPAHEVQADQKRSGEEMTPEAYEAAFAARVAELQAEQASQALTYTKGGGRKL